MTSDLWALVATLGLCFFQIGLASIVTLRQLGPAWVAGPRDQPKDVTGISGRLVRAHRNLLEIFPQFVAALVVVHLAGKNDDLAVFGAWLFFIARCLYVPAYAFGPTGLRPLCWMVAQIGIIIILSELFI